jgi:hypothetical protein
MIQRVERNNRHNIFVVTTLKREGGSRGVRNVLGIYPNIAEQLAQPMLLHRKGLIP